MKIKRFDITTAALRMIFGPGRKDWRVVKNPIPEDAEIVRICVDQTLSTPDIISLYVTSDAYDDLPEGTVVERNNIEITRYYDKP